MNRVLVTLGVVVGLILLIAGGSFAAQQTIQRAPGLHWAEAIQAGANIGLVFITAVYVYFTYRLFEAQNRQIRRYGELPIVRIVQTALSAVEGDLYQLKGITFDSSVPQPPQQRTLGAMSQLVQEKGFEKLAATLQEQGNQLSKAFRESSRKLELASARAHWTIQLIANAINTEEARDKEAGIAFDWTLVQGDYARDKATVALAYRPYDWEAVEGRTYIDELDKAYKDLATRVQGYIDE